MKIVNLSQGEEAWLDWRKAGITATDAAILLDQSPYKTRWRLWAEKVGFAREVDLSLNPLVRHGRENEDKARRAYEEAHGDMLLPVCVESSVNSLMRASLDGLDLNNQPVELKCPSDTVWQEVWDLGTQSAAYQLYYVQVQHQLLVTGAQRGTLVFWHAEHGLNEFVITLDKVLLTGLIQAAAQFWQQVLHRNEPDKDPMRDLFIPEGEAVNEWIFAAEQYRLFDEEMQELKARMDVLKAKQGECLETMKGLMGEYHHADYCGVMVTRYYVRGKVNYDKLLAEKAGQVEETDLDKYRGKPSERCRVTVTDSLAPRNIVEAAVLAPLDAVPQEVESAYF